MKLTIIPSDGAVYKDGLSYSGLALQGVPEGVHALQWQDTKGWIEYNDTDLTDDYKPPNEVINELPQWALDAVTAWELADQAANIEPVVDTEGAA